MISRESLLTALWMLNALALIGILGVAAYWASVGRRVSDVAVKVVTKFIQLIAGYASIRYAFEVNADKVEWFGVSVAGIACVILWQLLELLVDNRVNSTDKFNKEILKAVETEAEAMTELHAVLRNAVNKKVKRLSESLLQKQSRPSMALLIRTLTPKQHLDDLLTSIAQFFRDQDSEPGRKLGNFRVGLYVSDNGVMTPLHAADLDNPTYDVFQSYRNHALSFAMEGSEKPSHVVTCAKRRETIIVPDCAQAAEAGNFFYFTEDQKGYLKSLFAYYLGKVCGRDGVMTDAVIMVDTNTAGFFRTEAIDSLEFYLREFGSRIKLELLLRSLLRTKGGE